MTVTISRADAVPAVFDVRKFLRAFRKVQKSPRINTTQQPLVVPKFLPVALYATLFIVIMIECLSPAFADVTIVYTGKPFDPKACITGTGVTCVNGPMDMTVQFIGLGTGFSGTIQSQVLPSAIKLNSVDIGGSSYVKGGAYITCNPLSANFTFVDGAVTEWSISKGFDEISGCGDDYDFDGMGSDSYAGDGFRFYYNKTENPLVFYYEDGSNRAVGSWTISPAERIPSASTSFYVRIPNISGTLNAWMAGRGTAYGSAEVVDAGDRAVVFSFGDMRMHVTKSGAVIYGATGFQNGKGFLTTSQIQSAVMSFVDAYLVANKVATIPSHLTVVVGTTNHALANLSNQSTEALTNHAIAWGQMIGNIQQIIGNELNSPRVEVAGGFDAEPGFAPGLVGVSQTTQWLQGYLQTNSPLIDFGSADGCITKGTTAKPSICAFKYMKGKKTLIDKSWTQEDVAFIGWAAGEPLPQVYAESGSTARQWQQIALWSYLDSYPDAVYSIAGELTQATVCAQVGCMAGTNNPPATAWTQLINALNADPQTSGDLLWSTDISNP